MSLRHGCPAVVLVLLAVAGPVAGGVLQGSVGMRAPVAGETRTNREQAVVWLERIPERTERNLARGRRSWLFFGSRRDTRTPQLVAIDRRFEPHVVVVAAGGAVEFLNQDRVWHGTFSVSPAKPFSLGKREPGRVDTLRFATPGLVTVRCDIHPEMSAHVVVTPNHAFTRPDSAGRWRLPAMPQGRYVLRAWAPGRQDKRHEIWVPERGAVEMPLRW